MAIKKNLCLAYYSLNLFLERKELIEVPLTNIAYAKIFNTVFSVSFSELFGLLCVAVFLGPFTAAAV
ncbi:MAG: hypothetical protein U9Q98_06235 [Bacteroidota bacterium]|nr:hypothetical protein [Bacteroidota bacterium]